MSNSVPENALSQFDIGKIKTPIGFYNTLFHLHDMKRECCIPAIVKKYDRKSGDVTVQPLVDFVCDTPNGVQTFNRPDYTVKVRRISHGGYIIDIPLFVGDTGWLIVGDRNAYTAMKENSSLLKKNIEIGKDVNKGPQAPDDKSLADFAWGFFIPDFWGDNSIGDRDGIVIKHIPNNESGAGGFEIVANKNGISIERKTSDGEKTDKIALNDEGFKFGGDADKTIAIVSDIRYDIATHQIQKKTIEHKVRGDFVVGVGNESDWKMIEGGQAVPEKD